jgi:uncharacterized protein (DUF1697 family)
VALLRGINVGGNKKVPMKELVRVFEKNGFKNIKTLLASGNVVFDSAPGKIKNIQNILEKAFGFEIETLVVPIEFVEKIVKADPFKGIKVTPQTRLYVTFLKGEPKAKIKLPYLSSDKSFHILKQVDQALLSVLDLSKSGTVDAMAILEKTYGKAITTRNFNTVEKIAALNN